MKTLSTTLAIFALLLSTTAFSSVGSGEITPILRPRDPGFENSNFSDITPPLMPQKPRFEDSNFSEITPLLMPQKPRFENGLIF